MPESTSAISRVGLGSRAAAGVFTLALLFGGGLVSVVNAAPAEAACNYRYASANATRSEAATNTADCRREGRSYAQHGRYAALSAWYSASSWAYARDANASSGEAWAATRAY